MKPIPKIIAAGAMLGLMALPIQAQNTNFYQFVNSPRGSMQPVSLAQAAPQAEVPQRASQERIDQVRGQFNRIRQALLTIETSLDSQAVERVIWDVRTRMSSAPQGSWKHLSEIVTRLDTLSRQIQNGTTSFEIRHTVAYLNQTLDAAIEATALAMDTPREVAVVPPAPTPETIILTHFEKASEALRQDRPAIASREIADALDLLVAQGRTEGIETALGRIDSLVRELAQSETAAPREVAQAAATEMVVLVASTPEAAAAECPKAESCPKAAECPKQAETCPASQTEQAAAAEQMAEVTETQPEAVATEAAEQTAATEVAEATNINAATEPAAVEVLVSTEETSQPAEPVVAEVAEPVVETESAAVEVAEPTIAEAVAAEPVPAAPEALTPEPAVLQPVIEIDQAVVPAAEREISDATRMMGRAAAVLKVLNHHKESIDPISRLLGLASLLERETAGAEREISSLMQSILERNDEKSEQVAEAKPLRLRLIA